ncbi:MAG: substrate-binding periplasmic protein [Bdellovibrionales bacterium]
MTLFKNILITILAGAIGALSVTYVTAPPPATSSKESVYSRIMRTKTLRCGYFPSPIYNEVDPNTGKVSGVYADLMERIAQDWNIKIDWAEEVSASGMYEGFKTGRYDMLCSANTITAARTLVADFSNPIAYPTFYLFVREGDHRFDNAYEKANDPTIRMITYDGYFGATVTKEYFPKAKLSSLPELSNDVDILMSVVSGKADGGVMAGIVGADFMKKNPGKIRRVKGAPLRYPSLVLGLPKNEAELKAALNTSLTYYQETGVIEKILQKQGLTKDILLRIAKPYQTP